MKPFGPAIVVAAITLLSACSSATPAPPAASAPVSSAPAPKPAPPITGLKTAKTSLGNVIVDNKGMTVYMFTKDTKGTTTSACTGGCLVAWPIVTVSSGTPKLTGITAKVGTITSPDGKKQVTVDGWPIYYYAKDTKAGDVLGQNVGTVWFVLAPDGKVVK